MYFVRFFFLILLTTVVGCSATPKLMHSDIDKELARIGIQSGVDTDLDLSDIESLSGITYQATGSVLRIDEILDGQLQPTGKLTVSSVPVAAGETIYVVYPRSGTWTFARTLLAANYLPNTRLLSKLGVQVKDDRKQFVSAIGSVLTASAGAGILVNPIPPGLNNVRPIFPVALNAEKYLSKLTVDDSRRHTTDALPFNCRAIAVNQSSRVGTLLESHLCGTVMYGELPHDAVRRDLYMKAVADKWTDTFPAPACRSATIELNPWSGAKGIKFDERTLSWPAVAGDGVRLETVVSDPVYVRVVRLPQTGAIDFHTSCGTDIVLGDITTDPIWAAIAEFGTQTKAVIEAQDARDKKLEDEKKKAEEEKKAEEDKKDEKP